MINWLTKGSPLYFIFGREGNEAFVDDDFEVAIKVNGFKIICFPSLFCNKVQSDVDE